ncbi:oxidoreductase [Lichenihabitans sp. PAMC28606]|uniref:oxidoreductase n=1 Tax=Lichenihabitans sp. PAMC28606 TaxID=2880932 RepID=UPI001D0AD794|nr:oxidoreductase [Lichenihabitans sp. PAMC28606]UDL95621.1 oxidoreductase [Lichenihabitans sp. PAMC28606]
MTSHAARVALVTGVSSGIGQATAVRLIGAGYRVFGTSRKATNESFVDGMELVEADVTQDTSVDSVVSKVIGLTGRIDVLVNNAGIGIAGGAEESSTVQAQSLFDTNVFGVMRMTRAVLPHMRHQRSGRIINISSVLGFLPAPYMALYASSKHALEGYSESLDHELRTLGIRVLLVEPGYTKTSFEQNAVESDSLMSVYQAAREHLRPLMTKALSTGDAPDVVARVVVEAANARKPKLRYPAGPAAKRLTLLRRFAPTSVMDNGLRKQLGLDVL